MFLWRCRLFLVAGKRRIGRGLVGGGGAVFLLCSLVVLLVEVERWEGGKGVPLGRRCIFDLVRDGLGLLSGILGRVMVRVVVD